jgi:hypothetical protein
MALFQRDYGDKGPFLQLLSAQRSEEQEQYVKEILLSLGKAEAVTVDVMRRAFVVVDPHIGLFFENQRNSGYSGRYLVLFADDFISSYRAKRLE